MKLLGSTKSKKTEDEYDGNASYLETSEVILVDCNIVYNDFQQNSRVLHTFAPNKSFGQLLDISHKNDTFFKIFNSEFSYTQLQFTGENSKPLEVEDQINITLVFK